MTFTLVQFVGFSVFATVVATTLGFVAGLLYGRGEPRRVIERAQRQLGTLVDALLKSMEQTEALCQQFEKFPNGRLDRARSGKLERRRTSLFSSISRAIQGLREELPLGGEAGDSNRKDRKKAKSKVEPFSITWTREPLCEKTSLPMRSAFESNLTQLVDAATRSKTSFALMFVSIDKLDQLRSRFGPAATDGFISTTGHLLEHGVREDDLVCRYSNDTFAVLIPDVDALVAAEVAGTVRETLRRHRFHVEATGSEVLVTSSLGMAMWHPGENAPLLLGRVGEALRESLKRGRNQLHVHDGGTLTRYAPA